MRVKTCSALLVPSLALLLLRGHAFVQNHITLFQTLPETKQTKYVLLHYKESV